MRKALLTTLLLSLLLSFSYKMAGNTQYAFQQISTQNGLSSSVRCLVVSHEKGYVWIGTRSGIGRFDGYELRKYLHDNITHIIEDKENTIWAITPKGLFYYNYQEDEFRQARDEDNNPVIATSICPWEDGVLFGGSGKLYKYDYANHQIRFLCALTNNKYNITSLQKWDDHTLMCTNRWSRALLIDLPTGQTHPVPFESNELIATLIDKNGNIWVAPYHQGVKCYDRNGKLLHSYDTTNSRLQTNVILSLAERDGQIWVGTDGSGIYILNPKDDTMSVLVRVPGDPYSLPANSILYLYTDSNNNMWAGSVRAGLIHIKEAGMKIYSDALPGFEYALSEKSTLSIYQDEKEDIWIGTDGGGINRLDPVTKKFHHVLSTWGDKVSSITGVDQRYLLVSLFSKGLFFFDKQTENYQPLIIINDSINTLLCKRGKTVNVFRNTPETILLLSEMPYSYHLTRKDFTPIPLDKPAQDVVGTLLPICQNGFVSYLHDFKRIYRIDSRKNRLETLYSCKGDTIFNSVSADENGIFWIGSNYGLSYYSMEKKQCINIPNSLINEINSLICDQRGRVWIGADSKLFAHLIQEGEFILYGESDGIILNEYLEKPRLLSTQGDIYMGGVNGLLCINKQLPNEPNAPPILELADVLVGGERMNALMSTGRRLKVEEQSKPITIKIIAHDKDIFRKPMYRYTLLGMEGQVIYSYQPELTLSGLPARTYQVMASCSTRTGGWTKDYQILELVVLPPWYKSNWFISICFILIVSGVILAFFSLLHRKENKLKWAMKEHEQQVYEEKVRFLININHELRTPLTLIHAPLKQLLESLSPEDDKYPVIQSISKQSGRMKNLLNMVLDVRKMEVGQEVLHISSHPLHKWIQEVAETFQTASKAKEIEITYDFDDSIQSIAYDDTKCKVVLSNLIMNALKYSPNQTRIVIKTIRTNESIQVHVQDQGIGLDNVDIKKLFTRFYQGKHNEGGSGIGLSYAKMLIDLHGGRMGAFNNEDRGATFFYEIPANLQEQEVSCPQHSYLNELLSSPEEEEKIESGAFSLQGYSLLIVEDKQDLREFLKNALKDKFKKIYQAENGLVALEVIKQQQPDIIVSDVMMPQMNGYQLCKEIKENLNISHIPVILLTARADSESQMLGYKLGADAYLPKPFEMEMLLSVIQNQMRNREYIKSRYRGNQFILSPQEATFSNADEQFMIKLNEMIDQNLSQPDLDVKFLTAQMAMSRTSLYNKIKELTGMGANDYINRRRIDKAIILLIQSDMSITEISEQVGFTYQRYFSTLFKEMKGMTPSQFRAQHGSTQQQSE